ncbi:MAG: hypothetical protein GXO48_04135 [Chlorobi bacterium]|nr:hypothetical protein [Chlorobiota bacterium]
MKKPFVWIVGLMLIIGTVVVASWSSGHNESLQTVSGEIAFNWHGGKCGDGSSEGVATQKTSSKKATGHSDKCTCDQCKGKDGKCKPDCKCPHHAKADKDGDGKVDKHEHEHKCGGGKCGGGKCGCGGKCGM